MTALQMILAGLALPFLYLVSTLMFSGPKPIPTVLVSACSLVLIALGIWLFARNR